MVNKFAALNKSVGQKGALSPLLIAGIVAGIIVIFFVATGSFKFSASTNQSDQSTSPEKTESNSPSVSEPKTYTNDNN